MEEKWCLKVTDSLARVETKLDNQCEILDELKETVKPLPEIKVKLNGHLQWHGRLTKCLFFPLLIAILLAIGGFVWAKIF